MLVVIEKNYKMSVWCREIAEGLQKEARKKRISLFFSSSIDDICKSDDEKVVMIIGTEPEWLRAAVTRAKKCEQHPIILSNQSHNALGYGISYVSEDLEGSMKEIFLYFNQKGKQKLALYAVNPASASDECRKSAFLSLGGGCDDIFVNEGSLADCFEAFYAQFKKKGYDGIVCVNDFAAISLLQHLKSIGENIDSTDLISYSNSLISRCSFPAISSVRANFTEYGQMAFMIVDCLAKSNAIGGIRILGKWEIVHRDTSAPLLCDPIDNDSLTPPSVPLDRFYDDPELVEMLRIEKLLSDCDATDLNILKMILDQKKLSEIEEQSYLTETAVKYRIRKMKDICQASSRESLRALLLKYISDSDRLPSIFS